MRGTLDEQFPRTRLSSCKLVPQTGSGCRYQEKMKWVLSSSQHPSNALGWRGAGCSRQSVTLTQRTVKRATSQNQRAARGLWGGRVGDSAASLGTHAVHPSLCPLGRSRSAAWALCPDFDGRKERGSVLLRCSPEAPADLPGVSPARASGHKPCPRTQWQEGMESPGLA